MHRKMKLLRHCLLREKRNRATLNLHAIAPVSDSAGRSRGRGFHRKVLPGGGGQVRSSDPRSMMPGASRSLRGSRGSVRPVRPASAGRWAWVGGLLPIAAPVIGPEGGGHGNYRLPVLAAARLVWRGGWVERRSLAGPGRRLRVAGHLRGRPRSTKPRPASPRARCPSALHSGSFAAGLVPAPVPGAAGSPRVLDGPANRPGFVVLEGVSLRVGRIEGRVPAGRTSDLRNRVRRRGEPQRQTPPLRGQEPSQVPRGVGVCASPGARSRERSLEPGASFLWRFAETVN